MVEHPRVGDPIEAVDHCTEDLLKGKLKGILETTAVSPDCPAITVPPCLHSLTCAAVSPSLMTSHMYHTRRYRVTSIHGRRIPSLLVGSYYPPSLGQCDLHRSCPSGFTPRSGSPPSAHLVRALRTTSQ
ncbi:hypothetical protein M8818_003158 [Zalaria obscura]|uniref:Uncharacterized protein n=1 Tax=Zalaria obscura TaxID=2024903 RepID=A0ACC3SH37_9PEZI